MSLLKQFLTSFSYLFLPKSYSQLGEDLVVYNQLAWLGLDPRSRGFYVDIGAFHPLDGSNTYKLYRGGSSGVVVDVGPQKKLLFRIFRRRDVFVNAAVVPDTFSQEYVSFNVHGYGAKGDGLVGYGVGEEKLKNGISTTKVKAVRVSDLLDSAFRTKAASKANWLVMNLDIEGLDEQVVNAIDLEKYPFDVICIEVFPQDPWNKMNEYLSSSLNLGMETRGYSLQSVCGPTLIFLRKKSYVRKSPMLA